MKDVFRWSMQLGKQWNRGIFISLEGTTFKYSFLLMFECTNNIEEYEALLIGLNMVFKHKIKLLTILGDYELIISQVRSKYATKKRLKQYRNVVWDTIELFNAFSIEWIDRSKNLMEYFLANIALKRDDITLVRVSQVEFKTRPTILDNIYSWKFFNGDTDLIKFFSLY